QLASHAAAAYVTSCDVPLLSPAFIAHMISQLTEDVDVVVPVEEQRFHHPLAAVYRTSVAPIVADLLNHDQLRPVFLYDRVRTLRIDAQQLRAVDPELHSLMNVNHWDDYQHALGIYRRTMQEE